MTILPPRTAAEEAARDQAWAERKARYGETYPYGCRRCLRAGLRRAPDQWLHCHHVWGNGRIWDTGREPNHALMWLCQDHHKALHRPHASFCRSLRIIDSEGGIAHAALYSLTLGVWSWLYVLAGRVLLTSAARAGLYAAGVILCAAYGPAVIALLLLWPAVHLWRKR